MEAWANHIGNAYLEAETKEKIYIIGGSEFGDRRDHILVIRKALYGLRTSGKRWSERSADSFRELGFIRSKAEPDIWLRKSGDHYEYVANYVDDLALVLDDPQAFVDLLVQK